MKTKNIITIVLFCSFYITVQTQNDNENLLANVQATINNAIEATSTLKNNIETYLKN